MERLSRGPATVSELARGQSISLAAAVQHLDRLQAAGLVRSHKTGRVRTCRLDAAGLHTIAGWVEERRAACERHLDRLGEYLEATAGDQP